MLVHIGTPLLHSLHSGPSRTHIRLKSNPFGVLYDPSYKTQQEHHVAFTSGHQTRASAPETPANSPPEEHVSDLVSGSPPIVTVIHPVRRSGSVVSKSASLKAKNTIRRRNKMVKKSDAEPKSTSTKKRLRYIFPIKRKSSFKYNPPFSSQKEIDEYFLINNVTPAVRDLLPRSMRTFKFTSLANLAPRLHAEQNQFAISRDGNFTVVEEHQDHFFGEREPEIPSEPVDLNALYLDYRSAVFAGKHAVPPKFEDVMPNRLSTEDLDKLNTRLLFEVLLRRTLAAKIEYRLGPRDKAPKESTSKSSSPKPGVEPGKDSKKDSGSDSGFSMDTAELMQHNASLLSQMLPSPQISFASNIFDNVYAEPPTPAPAPPRRSNSYVVFKMPFTQVLTDPFAQIEQQLLERKNKTRNLSNIDAFPLRPRERSTVTMLSYDSVLEDPDSRKASTETGASKHTKRPSGDSYGSTTGTSLLHSLDQLSQDVSEYLRSEGISPIEHKESPTTYNKSFAQPMAKKPMSSSLDISPRRLAHSREDVLSNLTHVKRVMEGQPGHVHTVPNVASVQGSVHGGYTETITLGSHSVTRKSINSITPYGRIIKRHDSIVSILS